MIQKITNHVELAKERLMSQYKNSPVINMILEVIMKQEQDLEDAFYDLYTLCHLDTAFGVQLDRIGDIAGIQRYGLNDDDYRKRIYSQIVLNCSNGEPETLITALKLIMDATDIKYDEAYVGKIEIDFTSDKDGKFLPMEIDKLCLAGIKDVKLTQSDPLQPFEFAEVTLSDFQLISGNKDNIIVDSQNSEYNLYVTSGDLTYVDPDFALSDIFEEDGEIIEFQGGVLSECLNP
jgi:hypothetical protein